MNWDDLKSKEATVRFEFTREAIRVSAHEPERLYPEFSRFVEMLDSRNNVIVWTGLQIIGNLAAIDTEGHVDELLPKLFTLFESGGLVTAANTIKTLGKIALSKPDLTDKIVAELLLVESVKIIRRGEPSPECRNVAIGHVLDALTPVKHSAAMRPHWTAFIERQTSNSRPAVARKARAAIRSAHRITAKHR